MSSFNSISLLGNLTFKPELSYTPQGTAVCKMRLAVNQVMTMKDKTQKKETLFIDVVVWKRQAETAAQYLDKGSQVFIDGRLRLEEWTGKDGQKHKRFTVVAQRVIFLGKTNEQKLNEHEDKQNSSQDKTSAGHGHQDGPAPGEIPEESEQPSNLEEPADEDIPF